MVGSIDPRCETVRGTHWPKPGRRCVWSSRRGKPSWPAVKATASTGRTYGCKRYDQTRKKLLWHGGPSTYGSPPSRGRQSWIFFEKKTADLSARRVPDAVAFRE